MTDQELMNNYLLILKSCVEVYVHGTLESSNQEVRKALNFGLNEILNNQANTYDKMVENNWYKVNNVNASDISKVLNKVQKN